MTRTLRLFAACVTATTVLTASASAQDMWDRIRRLRNKRGGGGASTSAPARGRVEARASMGGGSTFRRVGGDVIELPSMPQDIAGLVALRDEIATTPEGAIVVFLVAANMWVEDESLGNQAFTIALDRRMLDNYKNVYKGYQPAVGFRNMLPQLKRKPYLAKAYFQSAHPGNGYYASAPYRMRITRQRYSDLGNGELKLFLSTAGADSDRPFRLAKNSRGIWKVRDNASSFFSGVRAPAADPTMGGDGDDI